MMSCTGIVSRGKSAFVDGFELFDVKLLNNITLRVAMGGRRRQDAATDGAWAPAYACDLAKSSPGDGTRSQGHPGGSARLR